MNYLVQNMGYVDKPLNIKHLVLDQLKNYGIFAHLREERNLGYDVEKYLHTEEITYRENQIKQGKEFIKKAKGIIEDFHKNGREAYDKYIESFNKPLDIAEASHWLKDEEKLRKRASQLNNFLSSISNNSILAKYKVKTDIKDMLDALTDEANRCHEYYKYAKEFEERLTFFSPKPLTFEEWMKKEEDNLKKDIEIREKCISETRKELKEYKKRDEEVNYS